MDYSIEEEKILAFKNLASDIASRTSLRLSKLVGEEVIMKSEESTLLPFLKAVEDSGQVEKATATFVVALKEGLEGVLVMTMSREEAIAFARGLLGDQDLNELNDMASSALKEVANILAGTWLLELREQFDIRVIHGEPDFAVDMLKAILEEIVGNLTLKAKNLLVLRSNINIEKYGVNGHYLLLLEPTSAVTLLDLIRL